MAPKKVAAGPAVENGGPPAVKSSGQTKAKPTVVKMRSLSHPSTLTMVMEALKKSSDRKGMSVPAIRNHILLTYPTVDPVKLKFLLRAALNKGLEKGMLIRPPKSNATGATGRFKLAKPGTKPKVEGENVDPNAEAKKTAKPKMKVAKVPKKPNAAKGDPKDENMEEGTAADKKEKPLEAKAAASKPKKVAAAAEKTDKAKAPAKKPKSKTLAADDVAETKMEQMGKKAQAAKAKDGTEKATTKRNAEKAMAKNGEEKAMAKSNVEKATAKRNAENMAKNGEEKAMAKNGEEKAMAKSGTEKAISSKDKAVAKSIKKVKK